MRVAPSIENINDASKYEFFAGHDAAAGPSGPAISSRSSPIAAWNNNMGCVTMTYDAPLKKYLMCVTDGGNTVGYFNTYILESDRITGPWKLVTYMRHFGEQAYFVNIPVEVHRRRRPHAVALLRGQFRPATGTASHSAPARPAAATACACRR